jgi:hypothetical protein
MTHILYVNEKWAWEVMINMTSSDYRQLSAKDIAANPQQYNGFRIRAVDGNKIYLLDKGQRRWITDPDTYHRLFRDWSGVYEVLAIEKIPQGIWISNGTGLFRTEWTDGMIFWLDYEWQQQAGYFYAVKRWVKTPEAMNKYHFNWSHGPFIPLPTAAGNLALIPDGSPLE